jgi:hypothetical protein
VPGTNADPRFAHRPLNGCGRCHQDFTSLELFDRHRVGDHALDWPEHENGRRCLDAEEMAAKGWEQDDKERWLDPARAGRARRAFSALGGSAGSASEVEGEEVAA